MQNRGKIGQKSLKSAQNESLIEKAKNDKKLGSGKGRGNKMQRTREVYKAWLLLPRTYLGAGEHVLASLGIRDPDAVELHGIRSQSEFAEKFGIAEPTLSHWKREMQDGNDFCDFRVHMQGLTKNVIGALYRHAISDGDAPRVKLWLQVVEGWNERIAQNISVSSSELSEEEKVALDLLIEKNTVQVT